MSLGLAPSPPPSAIAQQSYSPFLSLCLFSLSGRERLWYMQGNHYQKQQKTRYSFLIYISCLECMECVKNIYKNFLLWMRCSLMWMRSSRVVRFSDSHWLRSRNYPGFDPSILRHSGIWGASDETVLNKVRKKSEKIPWKIKDSRCSLFSWHGKFTGGVHPCIWRVQAREIEI